MPRRQEHGVHDVHDAVGGVDVRGGDLRVVDVHLGVLEGDLDVLALHGGGLLVVLQVGGVHGAGGNVVREHVDELRLVRGVEQVVEDGLGQRGERLVGGREDGERAGAGERVDEAAGLERGDERGEVRRGATPTMFFVRPSAPLPCASGTAVATARALSVRSASPWPIAPTIFKLGGGKTKRRRFFLHFTLRII